MNKITAAAIAGSCCMLLLPELALAQQPDSELGIVVGAGVEAHDNVQLTDEDEKSDVARIGTVGLSFKRPKGKLQADVGYVVQRRDYLHDGLEDESAINGESSLKWLAVPALLDLNLFHQSSQQRVDRREADVTSNRETRNIVGASANLYGRLTAVDSLVLTPGYAHVNVEGGAGLDSERVSGSLSYVHRTSQVSEIALTVSHSAVDTEFAENDYDSDSATLGYTTRLSRVSYTLAVGSNRIKRDIGDDVDGFMARVGLEYVGSSVSWGGFYVQQLTDTGIGLASADPGFGGFQSSDGNISEFDILESATADLHATYQLTDSSEIGASIDYVEQDYETTLQDEQDLSASLSYRYRINSRWQTGVRTSITKAEFKDDPDGLENKDSRIELFADYRPTSRFDIHLGLGRDERNSNLPASDYQDPYAVVMLNYKVY